MDDGRHRRPETLADTNRLRPAPEMPSIRRRSADQVPGFIEQGYPDDVARAQRRRQAEAMRAARRRRPSAPGASRTSVTAADRPSSPSRRHAAPTRPGRSGKHAAPPDLTVRDAVVSARDWALAPGERPAIGSHRAPGTLPVESWLLIGRARQQALLATLVAVGLALMMIPIGRHVDVNPIAAADRTIVDVVPGHPATGKITTATTAPTRAHEKAPAAPTPNASATVKPTTAAPAPTGPGKSLKVTGTSAIALTFDDGPDPVQTPKILALLDKYHVKATFCLIGTNVEKHPEIVREIVAAGHTLCNHTWNHSLVIGTAPTADIRADLERTSAAIHAAAPGAPIPFFRAPGGNFTDRLVTEAYGEGMSSLYWQVDPQDWNHLPAESDAAHVNRVVSAVEAAVKPGSIILSHDFNQPDTIEAYEQLLPYLTEHYRTGVPDHPAAPATTPPAAPPTTTPATPEPPVILPTADSPTGE